jgi:hypothetical protein
MFGLNRVISRAKKITIIAVVILSVDEASLTSGEAYLALFFWILLKLLVQIFKSI